jgi:hypothetical protein
LIAARGSIDDPATRSAACSILEGAREAFIPEFGQGALHAFLFYITSIV